MSEDGHPCALIFAYPQRKLSASHAFNHASFNGGATQTDMGVPLLPMTLKRAAFEVYTLMRILYTNENTYARSFMR